jgi:hypothetical protein
MRGGSSGLPAVQWWQSFGPRQGKGGASGAQMKQWFPVDHLVVDRLLSEWRWLCPHRMALVARTAFGDLFLRNEAGAVFWLNTAVGKLAEVARSEAEFLEMAATIEKQREWFGEPELQACASRGLKPTSAQCIGFSVPLVFAESGSPDTPYIADLYEYVSFLGDLHRQISGLPDGAKVTLRVQPPKAR